MNSVTAPSERAMAGIRHYVENALSPNTRKAYKSDTIHYRQWGGAIPASTEMIADYLSHHATSLSIATLARRLVSISKAHTTGGYPDPTKSDLVKLTFKGVKKVHGKPQSQVSPILKDDLIVMLSTVPATIKGMRDAALLMVTFCGALRRSETVAINMEDLNFTGHGVIITLQRSKTDQTGQGRKVGVPYGRSRVCPVRTLKEWVEVLGRDNGPLFSSVKKSGTISEQRLSDKAVAEIIKFYIGKAGMDPQKYSGHSLRSGLATSAAQNGVSSWKIRQQTGHKSDAMLQRYIRDGDIFNENAAGLF